jgi:phospholipid/cholesterol/gamma-HCH transport system ATP-binding protein
MSITHDLASARTIGDEIAMLNGGQIVWRGSPAELDRTDNAHMRQFVDARAGGPMTSTV